MASITLNSVSFASAIKKKQYVSILYKLASAPDVIGSYTEVGEGILVNIDGTFQAPIVINGLADCVLYTIWIINECSNAGYKQNILSTCAPGAEVKYGFTQLDTTGALPTEPEYISSVDDVFTLGNELFQPLVPGADIQIGTFENLSDKVLFIQVPASEAAFTLWSEVGNPLQQNQPIDPDYATGSNVWFKSTRAGELIYITRSQTTITGAVIISRVISLP